MRLPNFAEEKRKNWYPRNAVSERVHEGVDPVVDHGNERRVSRIAPGLWTVAALALYMGVGGIASGGQTAATPSPAPFAGALISEWRGDVHVQLPGASQAKPQRGEVLPSGTIIETGNGSLLVVLRTDESEILIQPHSHLVVKEPEAGSWNALEIGFGRVRAYIRKRTGGAPPFQMATPSAVIAVRGTRFDVEVNGRGVSEIDVFEGVVEVAGNGTEAGSVLVNPGYSTRVAAGKAPEAPVPTRDIRPSVDIPEGEAKQEFNREQSLQGERGRTSERESSREDRRETGEGGPHDLN
jgi:FecR protein